MATKLTSFNFKEFRMFVYTLALEQTNKSNQEVVVKFL